MKKLTIFFAFLLFVGFSVQAQVQISGTVTSTEDGLSIPGVSVVVKDNTTIGTTTDMDGKYTITVPSSSKALVFSFVGMQTQEVAINSRTVVDLQMKAEVLEMDEVIVVAYGTTKKSSFTGSASQVKSEAIEKMATTSFDQALQGTTAGLQIKSTSGNPGSQASVTIRGVGSLEASTSPLYVVDGIPVTASNYSQVADEDYGTSTTILSTINPNDIESITVLKDASAASLYGSRAANGVIIITTKSGKKGDSKIDFSANYGIVNLARELPSILNASEYWKLNWDEAYQRAVNGGVPDADRANWATDYIVGKLGVNPYNVDYPLDNNGNLVSGAKLYYDSDWRDAVYRTGNNQEYNLSASGGTDKTNFFLSGGYLNQEGIVIASDFERYTGKINVTSELNDYIKVGTNNMLAYSIQNTPAGGTGAANYVRFADQVSNIYSIYERDATGQIIYDATGNPVYNYVNPVVLDFNPIGIAENDIYNIEQARALTSLFVEITFLKDFKFKSYGSYDYVQLQETRYYNPIHGNGAGVAGRSGKYYHRDMRSNLTNTLTWNKTIADVHTIEILLGQEASKSRYDQIYAEGVGFPFAGNDNLRAASTPQAVDSYYTEKTISSYFGRLNYNFADKYYLSASLRRDGSSVFGADNRWGTFYSVGATWRATQEEFLKNIPWLTDLKFRASYGTSGNDNIDRYASKGLFGLGYNYGGQPGLNYEQLANPLLHWEANKNFNVGVDFRLFNRLTGEFDYYSRTSSDLLFNQPISMTTGFDDLMSNLAEMVNSGFEFRLISTNVVRGNFKWDTDFNIAFNKNEITDMTQEEVIVGTKRWKVGVDRYQYYIQEYAGVNSATGQPLWYKDVEDVDGNVIGRELTSVYAEADKYELGSALPDYFGGLTNTLTYKGIDFSFFVYFSMGGKIYDYTEAMLMHDGARPGQQLSTKVNDAWKNPGDVTDVPRYVIQNNDQGEQLSSRFLHDASYIRLRNVALNYTLPEKWIKPLKLRNVRIYVKADNLWTWAAYKDGVDPELALSGNSNNDTPPVKTFTFGINLGL